VSGPRVYLEQGRTWVFALAIEWPGWCRRARTPDGALATLDEYRPRYERVVGAALPDGPFRVVDTLTGNATTDFGAPVTWGAWDERGVSKAELARLVGVLDDCWRYFDEVVAVSPEFLRTGPRGGGRHRDAVAAHVREAERAYASKMGTRVPPRTPWDVQRDVLRRAASSREPAAWPVTYALRRVAGHVLDHAWEIEDRRDT
jgi:hypothetical protein